MLAIVEFHDTGMNIGWEHFVSQYDAARFVSSDGRDTRHIQFVREFASVVSVLQVCDLLRPFGLKDVADNPAGQNKQCHRLVQRHLARGGGFSNLFVYGGSVHRATKSHPISRASGYQRPSILAENIFPRLIDSTLKVMQILIIGWQS
jgi:hypothetical protein